MVGDIVQCRPSVRVWIAKRRVVRFAQIWTATGIAARLVSHFREQRLAVLGG